MVSNANEKKTCIARFHTHFQPLKKIVNDKIPDWKISSRNKEQAFAIDLLLNDDVKVVSLVGRAGSGKTLCAIAAGLQQTIGLRGNNHYDRMIVSRPVQPLGKDIGFLPGTMEEKMLPWLMPIQDNLQFLVGGDKKTLQMYMEKGKIEIEVLINNESGLSNNDQNKKAKLKIEKNGVFESGLFFQWALLLDSSHAMTDISN